MVDDNTDRGHDVMVAQFVFSFSRRFSEKRQRNWTAKMKTVMYFCEKNIYLQQFSMVFTLIGHRNDAKNL